MDDINQQAVWARHADQWQKLGSPLKPCREDSDLMHTAIAPALAGRESPAVGVLGVTPEIVQGSWPTGTRLQAFDHSAEIIARVWQPNESISSSACQAKWQNLPLPDHCLDVVVGDNAMGALPGLPVYPLVLAEVARVLKPGGILCLRCLVLPDRVSQPEQLAEEALAGGIVSFHALKWRLAMALSEAPAYSVATADMLTAFNSLFPDRAALASASQWSREVVDTIDAYHDAATRYSVVPLAEVEAALSPWFEVAGIAHGHYELADGCPTLTLKRRTGDII